MRHTRLILTALLLLGSLARPSLAAAPAYIDKEIWIGAGWSWPDYGEGARACARGGFGLVFARYVGLGISTQVDRSRIHYFGDASVFFPRFDLIEPYGRFQYGHRDDNHEAMGWVAGLRARGDSISAYLEIHKIFEPEDNFGFSLGVSF